MFSADFVGMIPSTTGKGGVLTYNTDSHTVQEIQADGFWREANPSRTDKHARDSAEYFVRKQAANQDNGVNFFIVGTNGRAQGRAYIAADGRISYAGT